MGERGLTLSAHQLPPRPPKERSLGYEVAAWMLDNLVHGPGDIQGQRFSLQREQWEFVVRAYEIDQHGRRVVRRATLSRPKGWAKSELAAAITCAEALGPVRFAGWDANGHPVGKPVTGPEIVCVATELGQSANVYAPIRFMLTEGPLADTPGLDVGLLRTILPSGGRILPSTGAAGSKDGGRQSFVVFDETHLMHGRELRELVAVLRRNLAKRKGADPWSLETTTAYRQGQDSVAEDSHRYALAVLEGRVSDPGLLFDHREGPIAFDWDDDDQLLAALGQAYGSSASWLDLPRMLSEIRDPSADPADSMRYFLNRPAEYEESWLVSSVWEPLSDPSIGVPPNGTPIVLGFDGSWRDDSTALIGATLDGHLFVVQVWEAPLGVKEWEVDRTDVDAIVRDSHEKWDVRRMYADPALWQDHISSWAADLSGVTEWWTNRPRPMASAIERFETAVRGSELSHDGNPILQRHVVNAKRRDHSSGTLLRKDRPKSPNKIDAAIAAVLAWEARADEVAAGVKPRNRSVVSW